MQGKTEKEVRLELAKEGYEQALIDKLAPQKVIQGNKPSNTILLDELTPSALGSLIALYEHKIFTQGVIWGINSFDQWGVELGKELGKPILKSIQSDKKEATYDSSTSGLIAKVTSN